MYFAGHGSIKLQSYWLELRHIHSHRLTDFFNECIYLFYYSLGFQTVVSAVDAPARTHKFDYRLFKRITKLRDANGTFTGSGREKGRRNKILLIKCFWWKKNNKTRNEIRISQTKRTAAIGRRSAWHTELSRWRPSTEQRGQGVRRARALPHHPSVSV